MDDVRRVEAAWKTHRAHRQSEHAAWARLGSDEYRVIIAAADEAVGGVVARETADKLAEEVEWAVKWLRGMQKELDELNRRGDMGTIMRSRLHDLIRCAIDGVQGRRGLKHHLDAYRRDAL